MILTYLRIILFGLFDKVNGTKKRIFVKIYSVIYCFVLCISLFYYSLNVKLIFVFHDSFTVFEVILLITISTVTEDFYYFQFIEFVKTEFCNERLIPSTMQRNRVLITVIAFIFSAGLFCNCLLYDLAPTVICISLYNGIVFNSCCIGLYRLIMTFDLFRVCVTKLKNALKEDLRQFNIDANKKKIKLVNRFATTFLKLIDRFYPVHYVSKFMVSNF